MESEKPIIEYASVFPQAVDCLHLEESADSVRVIFRAPPKWLYFWGIGAPAIFGLMYMATSIAIPYLISTVSHQSISRLLSVPEYRKLLVVYGILGIISFVPFLIALSNLREYLRFGRVSRTLFANKSGLTYSWLGWSSIRHRHWPVSEIAAFEFRLVKGNLDRWNTVADLKISFRKKRSRRFRLSSRDPQLPAKIAEQLRAKLGLPKS
jgi:hypothetical protein